MYDLIIIGGGPSIVFFIFIYESNRTSEKDTPQGCYVQRVKIPPSGYVPG
jgi:hypothetical protein